MANVISPTIVQLNNHALTHFLDRDYESSISMLRTAYEVFDMYSRRPCQELAAPDATPLSPSSATRTGSIRFMQCQGDDATSSSSTQEPKTRRRPLTSFHMDSTLMKEKAIRSSRVEPTCNYASAPGAAYSMYNRALVFSDQEDDYSLVVAHKHRTAAIILYNLALVHHTIGIQLGVSAALPHAVRLYEMALESTIMDSSCVCSAHNPNNKGIEKLLLALLNNLGNIYTHLYEFQGAQRCFGHLRVVLAALGPPAIECMDEDYTFFFLNTYFQGKELCFAPAA